MITFQDHLRTLAAAMDPTRPLDQGSAFFIQAVLIQAARHIDELEQELLAAGDVLEDVTCELVEATSPRATTREAA